MMATVLLRGGLYITGTEIASNLEQSASGNLFSIREFHITNAKLNGPVSQVQNGPFSRSYDIIRHA